jgi:hypothetical protein
MKTRLIGLIAVFVAIVACVVFAETLFNGRPLHAQQIQAVQTAPKERGNVKGGTGMYIIFEDANGTIRVYEASTGRVVVTITRQ